MIEPPYCNPHNTTLPDGFPVARSECGIPWMAIIVLTSFIVITRFILINMYIAVILENFTKAHDQEEIGITDDDVSMFFSVWERYDPQATEFVPLEYLSDFCDELDRPFRLPKPNQIRLIALNIAICDGEKVHCLDAAKAVVSGKLGAVEDTEEFRVVMEDVEEKFKEMYPKRFGKQKKDVPDEKEKEQPKEIEEKKEEPKGGIDERKYDKEKEEEEKGAKVVSTTLRRKKEDIASKTLQRAWREHKKHRVFKQRHIAEKLRQSGQHVCAEREKALEDLLAHVQQVKPPQSVLCGSQTSLHDSSINLSRSSLEMRNLPLNTTLSVANIYEASQRKLRENLRPLPSDAVKPIYANAQAGQRKSTALNPSNTASQGSGSGSARA